MKRLFLIVTLILSLSINLPAEELPITCEAMPVCTQETLIMSDTISNQIFTIDSELTSEEENGSLSDICEEETIGEIMVSDDMISSIASIRYLIELETLVSLVGDFRTDSDSPYSDDSEEILSNPELKLNKFIFNSLYLNDLWAEHDSYSAAIHFTLPSFDYLRLPIEASSVNNSGEEKKRSIGSQTGLPIVKDRMADRTKTTDIPSAMPLLCFFVLCCIVPFVKNSEPDSI